MQAFQNDVFNNMFDQWKINDRLGIFKSWSTGLKSLEKFNLFGNFSNISENEKVSKSFDTLNNLFSSGMKNVEAFSEASQKVFENGQEVTRKRIDLYQRSYGDFMHLLKDLLTTKNHEMLAAKQTDYFKKAYDSLIVDFKNLSGSLADSNNKIFESLNSKLTENIAKQTKEFKEATASATGKKAK